MASTSIIFVFVLIIIFVVRLQVQCEVFQNITVQVSSYSKGTTVIENVTTNTLNDSMFYGFYKIIVKDQHIQYLDENAVSDLSRLEEVILESNGIKKLAKNSFRNLPSLEVLHITGNTISTLQSQVLNCKILKTLILSNNSIAYIHQDAFLNTHEVRRINLDHNELEEVNPEWFKNTPNLYELSVRYNKLKHLGTKTFRYLKGLRTYPNSAIEDLGLNIYLDHNKISTIANGTFSGPKVMYDLGLSYNEIHELDKRFFEGVDNIHWLDLTHNNISCVNIEDIPALFVINLTFLDYNPWDCDCLEEVVSWATEANRRVFCNRALLNCSNLHLEKLLKME